MNWTIKGAFSRDGLYRDARVEEGVLADGAFSAALRGAGLSDEEAGEVSRQLLAVLGIPRSGQRGHYRVVRGRDGRLLHAFFEDCGRSAILVRLSDGSFSCGF